LYDLDGGKILPPPDGTYATRLLSIVIVHDHVHKCIVEACDPSHNDALIDGKPTHGHDNGVVVDVEEAEGPLAEDEKHGVKEFVVLGEVKDVGPEHELFIQLPIGETSTVGGIETTTGGIDDEHLVSDAHDKSEGKQTEEVIVDGEGPAENCIKGTGGL